MPKITSPSNDPIDKYRKLGFDEMDRPGNEVPRMPLNMTSLSSDKLGEAMSRYTAWREFAEEQHSEAVARYVQVKDLFDYEYAKKWNSLPAGKEATNKSKEFLLKTDGELRVMETELLEAEVYKDMLGNRIESYTNVLTVLSREITRREGGNYRNA